MNPCVFSYISYNGCFSPKRNFSCSKTQNYYIAVNYNGYYMTNKSQTVHIWSVKMQKAAVIFTQRVARWAGKQLKQFSRKVKFFWREFFLTEHNLVRKNCQRHFQLFKLLWPAAFSASFSLFSVYHHTVTLFGPGARIAHYGLQWSSAILTGA